MSENENIAVEIGPRDDPSITDLRERIIGGNPRIVYVDIRAYEGLPPEIKQKYVVADAAHLPFRDEGVSLIYLRNVFGAEGTMPQGSDGKYVSGTREHVGSVRKMADEFYRVLAPGGTAVVMETVTPENAPLVQIRELFTKRGFAVEEQYLEQRVPWLYNELAMSDKGQQLGKDADLDNATKVMQDIYPEGAYAIVLRKVDKKNT